MDGLEAVGFRIVKQLLEPGLLQAFDERTLAAYGEAPADSIHWHRRVLPSPELQLVRSAVAHVLGAVESGLGDVVRIVSPGEPPTPPHQDAQYLGTARPICTAWIPLHDCARVQGPLAIWPGSHRLGLLPHTAAGLPASALVAASWFSTDLELGDVLVFSSLTVHKALENRSGVARRSVDLRYV